MKIKFTLSLLAFIFCFNTNRGNAQSVKAGATMLSFGVGYSAFTNSYFPSTQDVNFSLPELSTSLDYFVISMYSIGLNVAYQSVSGTAYNYLNYQNQTAYKESVSRTNVNIRSMLHYTKYTSIDLYGGICLGYAYYNYTYSPANPGNINNPLTQPTIQAFIGVRAIITNTFSTYLNVGTGTPYFVEMGFTFSFGGKPDATSPQPPAGTSPGGSLPYVH